MNQLTFPVGTPQERANGLAWPGKWLNTNPYGRKYDLGYHTGDDLILYHGVSEGQPLYAIDDGVVVHASFVKGSTWGNLLVINHGWGCSRYGHLKAFDPKVKPGIIVNKGDVVGQLGHTSGNSRYVWAPHLHFDISLGDKLVSDPRYWPGSSVYGVQKFFTPPGVFLQGRCGAAIQRTVEPVGVYNVRYGPSIGGQTAAWVMGRVRPGERFDILDVQGTAWVEIATGQWAGKVIYRAGLKF
jgi:murein DD-endopeptidase MepM/ murein hydrolase activator NlpD